MLKKIISNNLQLKKVLLLFILTGVVYSVMLFITIPKVMSFSNGMKILDMMPAGYNYEYVISLFTTLGQRGREVYLYNQIPVDIIYPFLSGISFCLLLAFFLNKLNKIKTKLFYLCFVPLFAGLFDYLENFGIIFMLNNYPNISNFSVTLTNIFSIFKSSLTTIYFISLIIALVLLSLQHLKKNKISQ